MRIRGKELDFLNKAMQESVEREEEAEVENNGGPWLNVPKELKRCNNARREKSWFKSLVENLNSQSYATVGAKASRRSVSNLSSQAQAFISL